MLKFAVVRRALIPFLLLLTPAVRADTIHLKNGRVIVADSAQEKNGRIEYQIGDNTYRIPKIVVERIDKDGEPLIGGPADPAAPVSGAPRQDLGSPKAAPDVPPPDVAWAGDLGKKVVRDGKVDPSALYELESAKPDMAGAAYFIAGRFELEHGNRDQARMYFERALGFLPDHPVILTNYAALLIQLSRAREAVGYAERATQAAPDSADAYTILGYAYFNSDRTRDAIPAWEHALRLHPDPKLEAVLAKARREKAAEASFTENDTGHFTLRYEGSKTNPELREQIINVLEEDYSDLAGELGITPYQNIPVVLYTEQAFFDVTQAPTWTGAINDGKLRIPVQGVNSITPALARVLKHELAHSFINQASGRRCPQWLNEGLAQSVEPKSLDSRGLRLASLYRRQVFLPLRSLEGSFMSLSASEALLAYDESLAAVEYIREKYGMSDVRRILERLGQGASTEQALRDVLHNGYAQLDEDLGHYLAEKYPAQGD